MDINTLLQNIKQHPNFSDAGMVLCHNGVVRGTSRNGRRVSGLRVIVDHEKLTRLIDAQRARPGIVDVQVQIAENKTLNIGDDVMLLVVAGDIREHVIPVLQETLEAIKTTITRKTEFFVQP